MLTKSNMKSIHSNKEWKVFGVVWRVSVYLLCVKDLRALGCVSRLLFLLLSSPCLLFLLLEGLFLLDSMFIHSLIIIGGLIFIIL